MADQLEDPRLTAAGLVFEASAGLARVLEPTLKAAGLSDAWFEVLIRLARTPGQRLRMTELAAVMTSISPSGLTRLVDRLQEAGLVERTQCASDRRGAFAELTPEGEQRLREVLPRHLDDIERFYTGVVSARELEAFTKTLRKLRAATGRADD